MLFQECKKINNKINKKPIKKPTHYPLATTIPYMGSHFRHALQIN